MKPIERAIWRGRLIEWCKNIPAVLAVVAFVVVIAIAFLAWRDTPLEYLPGKIISLRGADSLAVVRTDSGLQLTVELGERRRCRVGDAVTVEVQSAKYKARNVMRLDPEDCRPER